MRILDVTLPSAPSRTTCFTYNRGGEPQEFTDLKSISELLKSKETFVWLDVVDPQPEDFALMQEEFDLHPLAIEDALIAHQRPKIEAYNDSWFVVVHAATHHEGELRIHEIAIFAGAKFVITVRAKPEYPLAEMIKRWHHPGASHRRDGGALLYTTLDTIVDGYMQIGESFEEQVDVLESALLAERTKTEVVLLEIFSMKRDLSEFRRAVLPMRDILSPIIRGDVHIFSEDELPYYRDVADHVARTVEQMDAARDLINNARETHIAMASNRQNEVAKQLTIVATIFLPLTFITGFFGQNFGLLVTDIASPKVFWWLGIGTEVVAVVILLAYFRYKRWF